VFLSGILHFEVFLARLFCSQEARTIQDSTSEGYGHYEPGKCGHAYMYKSASLCACWNQFSSELPSGSKYSFVKDEVTRCVKCKSMVDSLR
jgi:hypothetical protein